jgi:hypothetical protein
MFNKLNLQQYGISLVLAWVVVLILVWSWSLQLIVDQGNKARMLQMKQLRESQIGYLQQKQELWLQSQYSLISALVKTQSRSITNETLIYGQLPCSNQVPIMN